MKYLLILGSLFGCAAYNVGPNGPVSGGPVQQSCTVSKGSAGATVTCPDNTSVFVPNGTAGYSVVFSTVAASASQCSAGGMVVVFATDTNRNGVLDSSDANQKAIVVCNGAAGNDGTNGSNAVVSLSQTAAGCSNGGITILSATDTLDLGYPAAGDSNLESAVVCNGQVGSTGAAGEQGPTGPAGASPQFTPVIVINPCGPNSSSYKEALLGLVGGAVFSEFTGSTSTSDVRNTLLPDGSYYDTDSSECNFTVSTDASGNRTIVWDGSTSNGSGPWGAGSASYTASSEAWQETYIAPGN